MVTKIINILTYHDSEPVEIILGLFLFLLFPTVWILEHGFQTALFLPAIIVGFATLKAVCDYNLQIRRNIAYISFMLSIVIVISSFTKESILECPAHLLWIVNLGMAFFNLRNLTKRILLS